MGILDFAILAVIVAVIGGSVIYIYRSKKKGTKCIGCPDSGRCSHNNGLSGCPCHCNTK